MKGLNAHKPSNDFHTNEQYRVNSCHKKEIFDGHMSFSNKQGYMKRVELNNRKIKKKYIKSKD